ncbi:MAG: hypothetical protein CMH53_00070 [Myxococcales bacterium]|nr:hypothetical protein [Myxococcales bacterium]
MTDPEQDIARCRASAVKCCGRLPEYTYTPGLSTITCPGKCGFTESLSDWQPGALTSRHNARVLGADKFREFNFPGMNLIEYDLTSQFRQHLEDA